MQNPFVNASEETKARVIANIEKANSKEYQRQKAESALIDQVIDEMLEDPYWYEIAVKALESKEKEK